MSLEQAAKHSVSPLSINRAERAAERFTNGATDCVADSADRDRKRADLREFSTARRVRGAPASPM